jgi:hypothetical protein
MKQTLCMWLIGGIGLTLQLSCDSGSPSAPPASEGIQVTVTTRAAIPEEPVPAAQVTGGASSISFRVTRPWTCSTIVDAALSRAPHDLSIVARLWSDPLADCAIATPRPLVEYSGSVAVVVPGLYRVRIFEANGGETPRLIGSAVATIGAR